MDKQGGSEVAELRIGQNDCPFGVRNATEIEGLRDYVNAKFKNVDEKVYSLTEKIDKILSEIEDMKARYSDRLPVWATFAMTGMGTVIGVLVTAVIELWVK